MLGQRILTALVLLFIVVATLLSSSVWPFLILLCVLAGCALWEWLRLVLHAVWPRWVVSGLAVLSMLGLSWTWTQPGDQLLFWQAGFNSVLLPLVAVFWIIPAVLMVLRARLVWPFGPRVLGVYAVLNVFAVWYALSTFFLRFGTACLLSVLILIWCADIAAYFTGRAFGRHKLAPQVSPGKTWEGAVGGVLAATLWLLASAWWWPGSFGARLLEHWSITSLIAIGIFLASVSIIGDLFESLLKRRAGVKDSSGLLPGHGGVYDRIDAVMPVAPLALLILGA
ncbi:phosphatidate cytidylyltransferase [Alcaligenaceae bacterium CGII-47]|nr:phosphatidate cytidylyltransferase [Alcaligenaceae bacterium CGII-47]